MYEPTGEKVDEGELYKSMVKYITDQKLVFKPDQKYYVIKEATKTKEMTFKLTKKQVEMLKNKIVLPKELIRQQSSVGSKSWEQKGFPLKFKEEMRVMFLAQRLNMQLVGNKVKLDYIPIRGLIEL
jgi:hypothetical protein